MKTLGLIGGMSWESTALYYAAINRGVAAQLGGLHSAKLIISSIDFHEIVALQRANNWDEAGKYLAVEANRLKAAGADCIALAVNTMHKVLPAMRAACDLPVIDIRSVIAEHVRELGIRRVAILGTRYVMEETFYNEQIATETGCDIVTPNTSGRSIIHDAIYNELSKGIVSPETRERIADILRQLQQEGTDGAVLACTELPMLDLQPLAPRIPLIDSTAVHATACVKALLA